MSAVIQSERHPNLFESRVFNVERIVLDGVEESFLRGGRHLFPLLPKAMAGVSQIGVIGWGSQGPAQAQNLKESLQDTGIKVAVGLRPGSESMVQAKAAGFSEADGTLGEMFAVIRGSDLAILLISDAAQAELHKRVFDALRPGATLGLSHGFLLSYLDTIGERFPANVNVIAVCPKGMGPSVRRLYEQGREVNGAGINTSFAVEQDLDGRATDVALAWSVALGAPYTIKTTLKSEVVSDLFGERAILLGAVHGIVEALYHRYLDEGATPADAFNRACESLTGPIRQTISQHGLVGLDEHLDAGGRREFRRAYDASYAASKGVMAEIYDEIANESIIEAVDSLLPYMHARGVAYMVDNCSTTARLGTRKWGPRFQAMLEQIAFPNVASQGETPDEPPEGFLTHPVHEVLHQLGEMRPAVDISVS